MAKEKRSEARAQVDITPSYPEYAGSNPPWPWTRPDPRPFGYRARHDKTVRLLILPGRLPHDPAMNQIEQTVRRMMEKKINVLIVVPDCYRSIGEIMARRNGLDYMVINVDFKETVNLPTNCEISVLARSKTARIRVMQQVDRACVVLKNPATESFIEELNESSIKVKEFKPVFKTPKPRKAEPAPEVKKSKKGKKR